MTKKSSFSRRRHWPENHGGSRACAESAGIRLRNGNGGAAAVDATGNSCPEVTQKLVAEADAVRLGAVGNPLLREQRPEKGLPGIRKHLSLFANLCPVVL
jgi:3-isopropylmalate dehydrogenase